MTATPRNVALSRNASQNPATSASPASLSREASQRISASTATTTPRNVALSRNASQNPATSASPASLSREASQRISASTATMTTPRNVSLSRNASQNPATSSSPASSLSREASQRSAGTATTTTTPRNNAFSRNASQRSTAQIMFSNSTGRRVKPPPVQKNLECTLEELFFGCTKKVKVTRDVLTDRGQIVQEEEVLSIQVKPGWKRGTKITFEDMGNERLGAQPADVTFVIVEKGHPLFRREGDDLELTIGIPLVQALTGCDISIPLMGNSGETMNLMIEDIIYPGYQKTVSGQGMPKSKEEEEGERGDLRVLFLVEFPVELTEEQRSEVVSILE
ncbi:DnaJ homolog subfamily B member 13, partial [Linum grandiflorum]